MSAKVLRWLLLVVLAAGIAVALLNQDRLDAAALEVWVRAVGVAGPLVFIALYALAAVLFLPGSVLTLAGGALFGPVWGSLYNLTGATLGAALAFLMARALASDWIERKTGARIGRLKQGVNGEGWRFVAFVRLVPLFPFNLVNYALGLTRIPFLHYLFATALFMLPGAIAYTYLGYAGRAAVAGSEGLIQKGLIALALLGTLIFLPRLVARLRERPMLGVEELKRRLDEDADLLVLDVRTAADFDGEQGHLSAARNLPLEELPRRLDELTPYLERPIALVCRTDRRSAAAARLLARNGFNEVHVARGGMTDWLKHGWPVVHRAVDTIQP